MISVGGQSSQPFTQVIAERLVGMGLLESFDVRPIAPHRKEYEVFVRNIGNPVAVSLADVGFGVSQVMPVLLQCFYTDPGSSLLFEQPELHLHPRAQTGLADVFIDAIHAEEDGQPRHTQVILESHSEHLLRRIQRRIAEGRLKPEEAALYFCSPGPEGSRIEELKLDEDGNITNWPENFFGDEMGDLTAMTEAAMKRQMAKGQE
jgi:predicted ATPase